MSNRRHIGSMLIAGALGLGMAAAPAGAGSASCRCPVEFHERAAEAHAKSAGTLLHGPLTVRITDVWSGKTVERRIKGPTTVVLRPGGVFVDSSSQRGVLSLGVFGHHAGDCALIG